MHTKGHNFLGHKFLGHNFLGHFVVYIFMAGDKKAIQEITGAKEKGFHFSRLMALRVLDGIE